MQIKRFEAQDMAQALRLIKKEFGAQAVILSARTLKKEKGTFGFLTRPRVEVTAATDSYQIKSRQDMLKKGSPELREPHLKQTDYPYSAKNRVIGNLPGPQIGSTSESGYRPVGKSQFQQAHAESLSFLQRQMVSQGVQKTLAHELIRDLGAFLSSEIDLTGVDLKKTLTHILVNKGMTTGRVRIEADFQRIVAFVGPTGVGKTSTIAKLAAAAKLRNKNGSVALITLDNHRIGAVEQLRTYAKIIGVPIHLVSSDTELHSAIDRFANKRLILVDTPGISQSNRSQINDLKKALQKFHALEIHLLVSAATKETDLLEIIRRFKSLSFTKLLFTKLDESTTYGNLLNILVQTKVPMSYFTNGQEIPEGIEVATPQKLVDRIFCLEKEAKAWPLSSAILKRKLRMQDPPTSRPTENYQVGENVILGPLKSAYHSVPRRVETFVRKKLALRN